MVRMAFLEFQGVRVTFGPYVALEGVNLRVAEGEFVSLVGPTGCGKSTLLNLAAGLLHPTSGTVLLQGKPLTGLNPLAGYLFQQDAILPWRTARDNVALPLVFRGRRWKEAREEAQLWLEKVGLGRFGHLFPYQLSGGMRKRVGLAQVLIARPRLLLMDEPFSALDVQTRQLMENELLRLWEEGLQGGEEDRKTVLFVTHDLTEAIALSDRVVVMAAGPRSRPIGEFRIPLPRPRDVAEVRLTPEFLRLEREIWGLLREEVMRAHAGTQA
jgi:NitT/TauT family transport system ATP-binding protein